MAGCLFFALGCICLACSAKRRAEWYLGGAEDAFWAGIRVGFWITVGALIVCSLVYVGMYFAVGWIK